MRGSMAWVSIMIVSCALGITLPAQAVSFKFATLGAPGAHMTFARGITPAGRIVGDFWDAGGKIHGYVATSTP